MADAQPGYRPDSLIAEDIGGYLDVQHQQDMLRFITCGSVDDGKSTLIGRLLYDSRALFADQLDALAEDSRRVGTRGGAIDFALLVDGLSAEREQGITIDVAYRFFAGARRKFIVADCPGHEQYTRNMVTGASTANLAVILVDATKGVLPQTRRHSYICHLLGIRHVVLAVNKMDLAGYDRAVFETIRADYARFAGEIGMAEPVAIPMSGVGGDNVVERSRNMPWYDGPSLLAHLETVPVDADPATRPFRMPVQWVNRPDPRFRGYAGQIVAGRVRPGDPVRVLPGDQATAIRAIETLDGALPEAIAGQSVTLRLADEIDCSRGSVIAAAADPPQTAAQFEAALVWLGDEPLVPGRGYWLKLATQTVTATVQPPKYQIDMTTLEHLAAKSLTLNAIGVAEVYTDRPIVFEPYAQSRALGGFILIDKETGVTAAAGMLRFALRRTQNIHWQPTAITREARAAMKHQQARVLWFTGLSGAGKSTIANAVEQRLTQMGRHSFLLDGDNIRHTLNKDLGFTAADRIENIRRVGEVARLMADAGLIVLTAFISPFRAERAMVRGLLHEGEFVEIFIDTPLAVAEARDAKGLYAKARAGELANFTGIDSPYEPPEHPDIVIDTTRMSADEAADHIIAVILP